MNLTRLRRQRRRFAAYSLTRGVTQIVMSVLLVAVWQLGVKGILIASLTRGLRRLRRHAARVRLTT